MRLDGTEDQWPRDTSQDRELRREVCEQLEGRGRQLEKQEARLLRVFGGAARYQIDTEQ